MKAIAKAVVKEVAVKDMNPVTRALRQAESLDTKAGAQYIEAAQIMATERDQELAPVDAHPKLIRRAKAIVEADGVLLSKNTWEKLTRYLWLALAPDAKVTVKPASSKADAVVSPASIAINTIAVRNLSKAAQEVKAQLAGEAAPKPAKRKPRPPQATKSKAAKSEMSASVKYWMAHASERREFEAVLDGLGFVLAAKAGAQVAPITVTKKGSVKTVRAV